jgi:hypothetical protein
VDDSRRRVSRKPKAAAAGDLLGYFQPKRDLGCWRSADLSAARANVGASGSNGLVANVPLFPLLTRNGNAAGLGRVGFYLPPGQAAHAPNGARPRARYVNLRATPRIDDFFAILFNEAAAFNLRDSVLDWMPHVRLCWRGSKGSGIHAGAISFNSCRPQGRRRERQ